MSAKWVAAYCSGNLEFSLEALQKGRIKCNANSPSCSLFYAKKKKKGSIIPCNLFYVKRGSIILYVKVKETQIKSFGREWAGPFPISPLRYSTDTQLLQNQLDWIALSMHFLFWSRSLSFHYRGIPVVSRCERGIPVVSRCLYLMSLPCLHITHSSPVLSH